MAKKSRVLSLMIILVMLTLNMQSMVNTASAGTYVNTVYSGPLDEIKPIVNYNGKQTRKPVLDAANNRLKIQATAEAGFGSQERSATALFDSSTVNNGYTSKSGRAYSAEVTFRASGIQTQTDTHYIKFTVRLVYYSGGKHVLASKSYKITAAETDKDITLSTSFQSIASPRQLYVEFKVEAYAKATWFSTVKVNFYNNPMAPTGQNQYSIFVGDYAIKEFYYTGCSPFC